MKTEIIIVFSVLGIVCNMSGLTTYGSNTPVVQNLSATPGNQSLDLPSRWESDLEDEYEEASIFTEPDRVNFSAYEDIIQSQYITIEYPSSWNISSEIGKGSIFTFRSLSENSTDLAKENLRLLISPSQEDTIDELISVKIPLQDLNISEPHNSEIGDSDARRLDYTYYDDRFGDIKSAKIATKINETSYLFIYQAQASRFNSYWPTVEKMISSFEALDLLNYESFDIGMRLKYPSDWNKTEEEYSSSGTRSVSFYPTNQTDSDRPPEVLISSNVTDRSLDEEVYQKLIDYQNESIGYPDLNLEYPMNVIVSGLPAWMLKYSYSDGLGKHINATEFYTRTNDTTYTISYSADEEEYSKHLQALQIMVDSFQPYKLVWYDNFDMGMRLEYPNGWEMIESKINLTEFNRDPYWHFTISSICPKKYINYGPDIRHKVELYPIFNDSSVTLTLCSNPTGLLLSEEAEEASDILKNRGAMISGLNESGLRYPAYTLNYSYPHRVSNTQINYSETIMMNDRGRVYSFLFSAPEKEYLEYLPSIKRIIESTDIYEVTTYEKVFDKNYPAGIILKRPNADPWINEEIYNKTVDLIRGNLYNSGVMRLYVIPIQLHPIHGEKSDLSDLDGLIMDKSNVVQANIGDTIVDTTLGNSTEAHRINFSYYDTNVRREVNGTQLHTIHNNHAYIINFTSPDYFEDYLPTVDEIIRSLKIVDTVKHNNDELNSSANNLVSISNIDYPNDWIFKNTTGRSLGFTVYPKENNNNDFLKNLTLHVSAAASSPTIEDAISPIINLLKGMNLTGFQIIDSSETSLSNKTKQAQEILYTYKDMLCECDVKVMDIFTIVDNKVYDFMYVAKTDEFSTNLATIESMLDSVRFQERGQKPLADIKSGLPLNGGPVDLAYNDVTGRLYIAIPEAKQIQVMDGHTDQLIHNITIGAVPNAVAVNPTLNKIYVVSPETDLIYVIDGTTNVVTDKIKVGPLVQDIALDINEFGTFGTLIFAANIGNDTVSIVDDVTGRIVSNMSLTPGSQPYGIGIDTVRNKAFVTTNFGIEVIDYVANLTDRKVIGSVEDTIPAGYIPLGIVVNSNTSRAYIANSATDTVSVVDLSSNKQIQEVKVGLFPASLAFNPTDEKIYVSNTGGNHSVSVIDSRIEDGTVNSTVGSISVDSNPSDVSVDPVTNMIYLATFDAQTISTVNSTLNKTVSAVTFYTNPPNSGQIECEEEEKRKEIPENTYVRLVTNATCYANPDQGFIFVNWSDGLPTNSSLLLKDISFFSFFGNLSRLIDAGISTIGTGMDQLYNITTGRLSANSSYQLAPKSYDPLPITRYGTYTANFLSISSLLQLASPYLSIMTLIIVVLVAVVAPALRRKGTLKAEDKGECNRLAKEADDEGILTSIVEKSESLSREAIIGIDAAIIAGVLIFLTISEGFVQEEQTQITVITASIVFPFALSAIFAVWNKYEDLSSRMTIAGFVNLMVSVILLAIMKS